MASWCVGFGLACWCHCRVLLEGAAVRGVYPCSRVRSTCVTGAWSSHVGGGAGCLCTVLLEEAGAGLKVQSGALERHAGGGGCCLRVMRATPKRTHHSDSSTVKQHAAAAWRRGRHEHARSKAHTPLTFKQHPAATPHQHAHPKVHTSLTAAHPQAAPCSGTLQQLQQQQARSKVHTTLTAAPCSTLHSAPKRAHHSDSRAFKQHPAAAPACPLQSAHAAVAAGAPCQLQNADMQCNSSYT